MALLPMGAWAEELQPRATTTWLFNQFYEEATVSTITTTEGTQGQLYIYDKLYFCVGDANADRIRSITATASVSMPNATAPEVGGVTPFTKGEYVGLKFNAASRASQDVTIDNTSQYMLAGVKPIVAGKLYVLVNTKSASKTVTIYEGATSKTTASRTTSDWILLSCDVTANKRYFIGCEETDWTLYGVKFVPTKDATDLSQHDISVSVTEGYATFSSACNYRVPTGYTAYVVSEVSSTSATLKKIDHIPANTGVVLIGTTPTSETITMKNIRESDITEADKTNAASNKLIANIGSYALPATNGTNYNYTLSTTGFKKSTGSGNLAANKSYLRTTIDAGASRMLELSIGGGGATGISVVEGQKTIIDNVYYNLNGQRVAHPTKGLYIVNGKKVILK
ncbi:MAG: hypothetical protein IJV17_06105 [Prevotella sp.]|nr:hypothetical protein [Prevotella sp.]